MKKIIYIIAGVAVAALANSCGEQSRDMDAASEEASAIREVNASELADATDSLSYYLGFNEGSAVTANRSSLPEAMLRNFHNEDYITGVTAVLKSDTTRLGYIDGLTEGMRMLQMVLSLEQSGVKINREILLDAMRANLMADSINVAASSVSEAALDSLLQVISARQALLNFNTQQ